MSDILRVSVKEDLRDMIKSRANDLNITIPEYLRTLARLDIATFGYQKVSEGTNILYNQISDYQNKLGIYCTPIQEIPVIDIEKIQLDEI